MSLWAPPTMSFYVFETLLTNHQQTCVLTCAQPTWSLTEFYHILLITAQDGFWYNFVMLGHLKRSNLRQDIVEHKVHNTQPTSIIHLYGSLRPFWTGPEPTWRNSDNKRACCHLQAKSSAAQPSTCSCASRIVSFVSDTGAWHWQDHIKNQVDSTGNASLTVYTVSRFKLLALREHPARR